MYFPKYADVTVSIGVTSRQLACFKYEERSRVFEDMGTNEEVNLVSSERQQDGMAREFRLSSLLV